jgi:hypothetical protein
MHYYALVPQLSSLQPPTRHVARAINVWEAGAEVVPSAFCWTRFGTEAGETIQSILLRKDRERRDNAGVFLWGIGNSVAPGIAALIREVANPEVLFSPIKGPPRKVDVEPAHIVEWRSAESMDGRQFMLPTTFHVRGGSQSETLSARYALVCRSEEPLDVADHGRLRFANLCNLLSGSPVGASQVTAVVRRTPSVEASGDYLIALRARLVPPFFIRLRDPVAMDDLGPELGSDPPSRPTLECGLGAER